MDVLNIVVGIYNIVIGLVVGIVNLPRARKKIRPSAPEKHRVARDRHRLFFIWSGVLIAIGLLTLWLPLSDFDLSASVLLLAPLLYIVPVLQIRYRRQRLP